MYTSWLGSPLHILEAMTSLLLGLLVPTMATTTTKKKQNPFMSFSNLVDKAMHS
jgi:hypothetical protein